nr:23 kDa protein [Grapevine leafroll-associated virus 4]WEG84546.1 23 kDa protein [Grapevine leafroll-associated virus 4]WEG84553.1 23 kDa protein [Grapevine leafroll-associated virus 4]WEG84560.1 23 kDa protein [Grapevine leafroll-associated virus 4]WEG84567.1 23 kDa protein [Grapevine leafroll-associated virus 4]
MEVTLYLSKAKENLPVACDETFYLRNAGVYATVMPPERLSFFYDKLSVGNNSDRNKYRELFQFLDNLGNVVATNNGNFIKFLDVDSVMEYFRRRYPDGSSLSNMNKTPSSDYCCLTVPALTTFLNSVCGCLEGLTTVLAVGFTRNDNTDELWSFKDTFVVFENSGVISTFYGDNMDTSNSALLEVLDSFGSASGKTDFEKVVNLLSI